MIFSGQEIMMWKTNTVSLHCVNLGSEVIFELVLVVGIEDKM